MTCLACMNGEHELPLYTLQGEACDCPCHGTHWTIQQFTWVAGRAYYAVRQLNIRNEVQRQWTGTREEMEQLIGELKIDAEELPATTEEEFTRRGQ